MTESMADFISMCREETEQVSRLVFLLEQEQAALVLGEVLRLECLADEKNRILEQLDALSKLRADLLERQGLKDRQDLLAWLADKPEACTIWMVLEDALKKAMTLNTFNGQQIVRGLVQTQQALGVLRTAAASMLSYGRDGSQAEVPLAGRHLGSA